MSRPDIPLPPLRPPIDQYRTHPLISPRYKRINPSSSSSSSSSTPSTNPSITTGSIPSSSLQTSSSSLSSSTNSFNSPSTRSSSTKTHKHSRAHRVPRNKTEKQHEEPFGSSLSSSSLKETNTCNTETPDNFLSESVTTQAFLSSQSFTSLPSLSIEDDTSARPTSPSVSKMDLKWLPTRPQIPTNSGMKILASPRKIYKPSTLNGEEETKPKRIPSKEEFGDQKKTDSESQSSSPSSIPFIQIVIPQVSSSTSSPALTPVSSEPQSEIPLLSPTLQPTHVNSTLEETPHVNIHHPKNTRNEILENHDSSDLLLSEMSKSNDMNISRSENNQWGNHNNRSRMKGDTEEKMERLIRIGILSIEEINEKLQNLKKDIQSFQHISDSLEICQLLVDLKPEISVLKGLVTTTAFEQERIPPEPLQVSRDDSPDSVALAELQNQLFNILTGVKINLICVRKHLLSLSISSCFNLPLALSTVQSLQNFSKKLIM